MPRTRFYRDPVHGQIRYDASIEPGPPDARATGEQRLGWLLRHLIDCPEFQRLRHVHQNGLVHLVFHGAEHSRFAHSMGVAYLAREMYDRIVRNTGSPPEPERRLATTAAALLHDVGHGPFSHTLEEILKEEGVPFHHEYLTLRLIEEPDTALHRTLSALDPALPAELAAYIDKDRRRRQGDHWSHRIVSSQLDADRLDYLLRDVRAAGLLGPSFDLPRLLDLLGHLDERRITVDRRALEAVEAYLLTLDHMYRTVYYHHAVRAASALLSSTLRRAFDLFRGGARDVFPTPLSGGPHPLALLFEHGHAIALSDFLRLGEYHVFALADEWRYHRDPVLADLARRFLGRHLFKSIPTGSLQPHQVTELRERATELAMRTLSLDAHTAGYYVILDEPARTSYQRYVWRSSDPDESIWMVGGQSEPRPIEDEPGSAIISALKDTRHFPRLLIPAEIRAPLEALAAAQPPA